MVVVVCLFLILFLAGAIWNGQQAKAHALSVLSSSLKRSHKEISASKFGTFDDVLFSREELQLGFCGTNTEGLKFFSFIPPNGVWVSMEPVKCKTTNLWCVVRAFDQRYYGIDGYGKFRDVSEKEFSQWPHVPVDQIEKQLNQK